MNADRPFLRLWAFLRRWARLRPPRVSLRVERLEDRAVPAAVSLAFGPFQTAAATGTVRTGEADIYAVSLQAGDTITARVSTASTATGLASALRVFNAAGTPLALDDRRGGDAGLTFQAASAGTYLLGVSNAADTSYSALNPPAGTGTTARGYTLQLRREVTLPRMPDLAGASFQTGAAVAARGDAVPVSFRVDNRGGADAGNFHVEVVLADSSLFPAASTRVLATLSRSQLIADAAGRSFTAPAGFAVTLPADAAVGPMFLGLRIVGDPLAPESNVTNNAGVHRGADWQPLVVAATVPSGVTNLSAVNPGLNTAATGTAGPGSPALYTFTVTAGGRFTAGISATGAAPRLTLVGLGGQTLLQADSGRLDLHLRPGTYTLAVTAAAPTAFRLTTAFTPTTDPSASLASGAGTASVATGDFNNDGIDDFVTVNRIEKTVSVFLAVGDGTFAAPRKFAIGSRAWRVSVGDANGDGRLDILTGNKGDNTVSILAGNGDGTFRDQLVIPAGTRVGGASVADVNGDGVPDLIADNYAADNVQVNLGNGDGTFGPPAIYPTDNHGAFQGVLGARAADLNGDGVPDLYYSTYVGENVVVRLGNGDGTFGAERKFATRAGSYDARVADVNGDGRPDFVNVNTVDNSISVLLGNGDGTFQTQRVYAVGLDPYSLTLADVNGDGVVDAVTSNRSNNSVSVLLGNGDGTLRPRTDISTGKTPRRVAAGDFNGDGKIDLVTANLGENTAGVLLGNGDGTFAGGALVPPAPVRAPFSVFVADLNGDGRPDVVTANRNDNTASVLLANADGSFQTRQTFAVDRNPFGVTAGDLDGDGVPELLTANYGGGSVTLLRGVGDGTFADRVDIPVGSSAYSVKVADVNGDGKPDILVVNKNDNNVGVLLGNGDRTFQPMVTYPVASGPYRLALGDVNHDGILDLTVSHFSATVVDVLIGNGDGTFQPTRQFPVGSRPYGVAVADINGDGNPDIVTANYRSSDASVLLGNGDGAFQAPVRLPVGLAPVEVQVADLNGDGRPDLVTANYGGGDVTVRLGNGDGTFQAPQSFAAGSGPASVAVRDMDGDGRLDLVVGNRNASTVSVLRGNGDGTFAAPVAFGTGPDRYSTALADVNGDGYPDLLKTASSAGTVTVQLGTGTGSFGAERSFAAGAGAAGLVVADINRDGRPDLVVAGADEGTLSVLLGNGDGTFGARQAFAVGRGPRKLVAADLNGDGILDLAATDYADGTVSVLLGNGDGTFQARQAFTAGTRPYSLAVGDVNGDGVADLVTGDAADGTVSVLLGNGDGTFQARRAFGVGRQPFAVALLDADGDGQLDIATANAFDGTVSVLRGNGDGTFASRQTFAAGVRPYSLAVADLNGDGKPDLIAADYGSGTVSELVNDGSGRFTTRLSVPAGPFVTQAIVADVNTDGRPDLVTVGNADRGTGVLLGLGGGAFRPLTASSDVDLVDRPFLADLDGDGIDDRIVLDRSGAILFRKGISADGQNFAPPRVLNPGRPARDIAVIRTAAGLALAAADAQSDPSTSAFGVSLYSVTAGGTVSRRLAFTDTLLPVRLAAADLNSDGLDDLVAVNSLDDAVGIAFQRADGSFAAPLRRATGRTPSDVTVTDLNGDGRPDVVVSGQASGDVTVLVNDASQSFTGSVRVRGGAGAIGLDTSGSPFSPARSVALAAGDFTGDGRSDLVVVNRGTHALEVLAGDGHGGLADPTPARTTSTSDGFAVNARPGQAVVGDFNRDGKADLAVLMEDAGELWIFLGNGNGTFRHTIRLPVGDQATGLRAVTRAGGLVDLLVGNGFGDVLRLEGKGDGTFQISGRRVSLSVVPDLTGTGQAVVLVANQQDNRVTVQQQGAGGSFGTVGQLAGGTTQLAPGDVAWTQLRPAGQLPDPVVVSTGSNAVVVYRTIGVQGSVPVFDPNPRTYFVGTTPVSATAADLNNDGVPDLIVANRGSNDVSVIFGSYVGGEWVGKPGPRLRTGGAGPLSVVARDQTGDGVLDLLVFNGASGTVTLLPGVGQGFFDDRSPQTVLDLGDSLAQAPTFVGTTPQGYAVTAGGRLVAFDVAVPGQSTVIDTIRNVVAARALANGTVVAAFGDGSVRLLTPVGNTLEVSAVLQTAGGQAVRPSSVEVVVGANGQLSVLVSSQGSDRIALYGVGQVTGTGGSSGGRGTGGFSLGPAVAGSGLGGAGSGVTVAGESGVSVASASVSVASAGVSAGFVLFSSSGGFGGSGTTSGFSTSAASGQLSAASVLAPGLASASPSSDGGSAEADSAGLVSLQGSSYSTVALLGLGSPHDSGSGDGDERQPDLAARYPFGSATQAERFVAGNGEKERYLQEGPERLEEAGEAGADPWREDPFHRSFRVRHLPPPSAGATDEIERLPLPREEAPADGPPSAALLAGLVLAARRSRRRKGRTP